MSAPTPPVSFCQACGRARELGEWGCPCGCDVYGAEVPPGVAGAETFPLRRLAGALGGVLSVRPPAVIGMHGRRGSGKTTLALQACTRPHVVTAEMDEGLVAAYLTRLGVRHHGISRPRREEDPLTRQAVIRWGESAESADELVLDSATETGDELLAVETARAWATRRGGVAIVIFQHTKAGDARGSAQALHACDVEVLVEQLDGERVVSVVKNRFGGTTSAAFDLAGGGPAQPARDRYYSVEGEAPAYRLVPYPSPRSGPYAAFWRWAEAQLNDPSDDGEPVTLPDAPCAVAALRSELYRPPWSEPPDVADRAAFARAQGVPYWSPRSRQEVV